MTDSLPPMVQLESTKEALAILQSLRDKRRKESPSSIFGMVKEIYALLRNKESQNFKKNSLTNGAELNRSQSEVYLS